MSRKKKIRKKFKPQKEYDIKTLNEMFIIAEIKKFGLTLEDIKNYPKNSELDWFEYYTFDSDLEHKKWKEYCCKLIRKHYKPWYINKAQASKLFGWFDLQYGLSVRRNETEN